VLLYLAVGATLSVPIMVLLYLKLVANEAYVGLYNKRPDYRGQGAVTFVVSLLAGPFFVLGSALADIIALNELLMKDEKRLEFKYQN